MTAPTRPHPLFIVSRTLRHAKDAAIERGLPSSPWTRHWVWVRDWQVLRGYRGNIKVLIDPSALERPDWSELQAHLAFVDPEYVE